MDQTQTSSRSHNGHDLGDGLGKVWGPQEMDRATDFENNYNDDDDDDDPWNGDVDDRNQVQGTIEDQNDANEKDASEEKNDAVKKMPPKRINSSQNHPWRSISMFQILIRILQIRIDCYLL